ncbi:MGMT family [Fusarium tjaetaba]|uniref:MGMT family n=1 Tax=Fusarium tjaetaba TaxID=1567544 RepID=A0A8H5VNS4_9HYPO|nr:MGMT family [Fusarium tjaetaba]KAF5627619.1 MGMT family [Fusarium tjaetaba]
MPRSDEAQAFFHAVYSAVQEIPHGKVTTYGHIAMLVGTRTKPPSHTQKLKSLTSNSSKTSSDLNLEDLALKLMPSKQKAYKSRQTQWANTPLTSPNTAGSQTYSPQKKTSKANE